MVEHDELIQDLHEDLKEWIITRVRSTYGWFQTLIRESARFENRKKNYDFEAKPSQISPLLNF